MQPSGVDTVQLRPFERQCLTKGLVTGYIRLLNGGFGRDNSCFHLGEGVVRDRWRGIHHAE